VLIVDSLIISGVRFVLNKLIEAVDAEMYDESALREELLAAQMKLELGEITEEEFASVEEVVLAGLREVGERKKAAAAAAQGHDAEGEAGEAGAGAERRFTVESVSADFDHREEPDR
jgi:hypothetical protein